MAQCGRALDGAVPRTLPSRPFAAADHNTPAADNVLVVVPRLAGDMESDP
jgi:hypothetical protein